jgi:aminoglycoside phosphotransferase family enzyme/predicted kinase
VERIEVEETHISEVFLTGPLVYKLKKPIDLGFLDFTTLEKRKRFCERELDLNQRLSDEVYRKVLPITTSNGDLTLGGPGRSIEYVLEMRELPRQATMEHHLESGTLTSTMIRDLAARLAGFHAGADGNERIDRFGTVEAIGGNVDENFEQIEPVVGRLLRSNFYDTMRHTIGEFLKQRQGLFEARIRGHHIRDGHGDLRLDHVYFVDGIQVIDCIEFNDRFRYGDVASDLAFLVTELDFRHAPDLGHELARAYARVAEDPDLFAVLHFYKNYRALVRTKVECLRVETGELDPEEDSEARSRAERYFQLAHRYARIESRPTLLVVCGAIASGKSTVAGEIARRLGVDVYRSDAIRKEIAGLSPQQPAVAPLDEGIYSSDTTERTYRALLERAGARLAQRHSLVLDATYSQVRHRRELIDAARRFGASIVFLECRASPEALRHRLEAREKQSSVSDGRLEHLDGLLDRFEPLTDLDPSYRVRLDTQARLVDTLVEGFAEATLRREQQSVETVD